MSGWVESRPLYAAFPTALEGIGEVDGQASDARDLDLGMVAVLRQPDPLVIGAASDDVAGIQPAKAAQKDTDARWTVKTGRRKNPAGAQRRMPDIAIPVFGYSEQDRRASGAA